MVKRSIFLKVMGILMIVGASISLLIYVLSLVAAGALASIDPNMTEWFLDKYAAVLPELYDMMPNVVPELEDIINSIDMSQVISILVIEGAAGIAGSSCQLAAGILGLKHYTNPNKMTACIVLSSITLVVTLFMRIAGDVSGMELIGIVAPILTIIAAAQFMASRRRAYEEQ